MNSQPAPATVPENPTLSGEMAASAFLAQEVPQARKTLKRTRIVGISLICFVGAYMGTIGTIMVKFFQPQAAAQVASGMLAQHVNTAGPVLAAQLEREIPLLIRQTPDYLIKEIPAYRKELQQMLETEYQTYCNSFSKDLGDEMDKLIDSHKAELKTLLENAKDRAAIRKVLPDFDQAISDFMKIDADGRNWKRHIDDLAVTLKEVEKRMGRLANDSDLTPEEKKARHAMAMLAKVIDENTRMPASVPVPDPEPLEWP
jgi:hypothetical protein